MFAAPAYAPAMLMRYADMPRCCHCLDAELDIIYAATRYDIFRQRLLLLDDDIIRRRCRHVFRALMPPR